MHDTLCETELSSLVAILLGDGLTETMQSIRMDYISLSLFGVRLMPSGIKIQINTALLHQSTQLNYIRCLSANLLIPTNYSP